MALKPRRILINAFSAKLGGGKTYINNLLQRLPLGDFHILIFAADDVTIPNDPRLQRMQTSWPTDNPIFRSWWEKFYLPFLLRKEKIDILFCPGGVLSTPKSKHYKIITMFRNMLPFDPQILASSDSLYEKVRGFLRKRMMLKSMTSADSVIFISHFARKVIESLVQIKNPVTIPHGISSQFNVSDQNLPRPQLPFAEDYILYVSRFEFYKRHLEVVKAYELLPKEVRSRYKLLLVGGTDLPYGQQVLAYVKQQELTQFVIFLGEYPYGQLPALYKNAGLFIFASTCENCPNILLEAMGSGVQILCSNYEPMPEFGGAAVQYMNPDSSTDISQKIQLALSTGSSAAELKAQAAKFSWDLTAEKTWKVLLG